MNRSTARILGYLLLTLGIGCLVITTIEAFGAFIFENHGIEFYARQPSLILLIIVAAAAMGFVIDGVARWKRMAGLRQGNAGAGSDTSTQVMTLPTAATRKVGCADSPTADE